MKQKWNGFVFAGSMTETLDNYILDLGCNKLYSQFNERSKINKVFTTERNNLFIIDSGAFSAARSNKVIDLDEYIQWINNQEDKDNRFYVELDVTPLNNINYETLEKTAQQSWDNYLYMIERVNKPEKILPVYHLNENISNLDRILNTSVIGNNIYANYVFIGGIAGLNETKLYEKFDIVWEHINKSKNPDVNIHALGVSKYNFLEAYPFYTADSTSWLMPSIYRNILTPYGSFYCGDANNKGAHMNIKFLNDNIKNEIKKYFDFINIDFNEFVEVINNEEIKDTQKIEKLCEVNISYYKNLSDNYQYKPRKGVKKLF